MVLILLVVLAIKFGFNRSNDQSAGPTSPTGTVTTIDTTTTDPATTDTSPTTDPTTEPTAGPAGLVAISQPGELADNVAAMFETYFGGINAGDAARALSVVKPSKKMDPSNPSDVADFGRAIATTQDDDIRLGAVSDNGSTVSAELSFRSHQDPGYGPKGSTNETCTRWTMHYTLADGDGGLLIQSVDAHHQSC
jgi:hypothetical protein